MGAGNSTYSDGSSGSFSFEPQFFLEDRRRSRWDHLVDTSFGPSPFLGGAGMPDLSYHGGNQAITNGLGMRYPLVPTHGTMSGGTFDNPLPILGPHFSGPGIVSPLVEPLFDPVPGFHRAAFDIPCSPSREPKSFETPFRPSPEFMQDSHLEHPIIIEKPPEPAPNLHTGPALSTSTFSSQPKEVLDIERPWKLATGIIPTTDVDQLLRRGRLDAMGFFQAESDDSGIRIQQDFSLLPNPTLHKMESSVAFNKSRTGIGLNISSRGPDTVDTLWISDTSLLSSPCGRTQLSGGLSRLHDGSIFDSVERYAGTASLGTGNVSGTFQSSTSVTALTNPGLLFIDNRITFTFNSGDTKLSFGSNYDVFNHIDTLDLGVRHTSLSDDIAKTLGVDKIGFQGKVAGQVRGSPMSPTLIALDLALEGSKFWNKNSQTSVGVETDFCNGRLTAKGKHAETIKRFVKVEVEAQMSLSEGQTSKHVGVSIKPVFSK